MAAKWPKRTDRYLFVSQAPLALWTASKHDGPRNAGTKEMINPVFTAVA